MSLAEWVSAKPLPDLCQPYVVARRMRISQTVARSTSAAWCRSQSASQPNCCLIHVSHMMSLRVRLSYVARSVVRSMSAASCRSQSESQPNRCPIHVTCVVVWKVCPANVRTRARMKARMKARMRARNEDGNEGENEGEDEGGDAAKSKQSHLYNRIWLVKDRGRFPRN